MEKGFRPFSSINITVGELDNDLSIGLKLGVGMNLPLRYLVLSDAIDAARLSEEPDYLKVASVVDLVSSSGETLSSLVEMFSNLQASDIAMIYTTVMGGVNDKNLQAVNDIFLVTGCCRVFSDLDDFSLGLNIWKEDNRRDLDLQRRLLESVVDINSIVEGVVPHPISSFMITGMSLMMNVSWPDDPEGKLGKLFNTEGENRLMGRPEGFSIPSGKRFIGEDSIDVFNSARTTKFLPYVSYHSETQNMFKIYEDHLAEDHDYSKIIPELTNYEQIMADEVLQPKRSKATGPYIVFTIWNGYGESLFKSTTDSFNQGIIDFNTSTLYIRDVNLIRLPLADLIRTLKSAIPLVHVSNHRAYKIGGRVSVYGSELNKQIFNHLVSTDRLISNYVFSTESTTPQLLKNRTEYRFRTVPGVYAETFHGATAYGAMKFNITQGVLTEGQLLVVPTKANTFGVIVPSVSVGSKPSSDEITKELQDSGYLSLLGRGINPVKVVSNKRKGVKYLDLAVTGARDISEVRLLSNLLPRLLSYYRKMESTVWRVMSSIVPEVKDIRTSPPEAGDEGSVVVDGGNRLRTIRPDIFVEGYPRRCQSQQQPTILFGPPDKGEIALPFPMTKDHSPPGEVPVAVAPEDGFLFTCRNESHPYPGVIINKLDNAEEYPTLPCCFREDQFRKNSRNLTTQNYYSGGGLMPEELPNLFDSYVIKNSKALNSERAGKVSEYITKLFAGGGEYQVLRVGVPISRVSIIHAILRALETPDYIALKMNYEREGYAISEADKMGSSDWWYTGLLRQEMYDWPRDKIRDILRNGWYIDSRLFIRLLEEWYSTRIFVINDLPAIEIPRSKLFHIRHHTPARCIVLYKHMGNEADNLVDPHYECLMQINFDAKASISTYDESMTEKMDKLAEKAQSASIWTYAGLLRDAPEAVKPSVGRSGKYPASDECVVSRQRMIRLDNPFNGFDVGVFQTSRTKILGQYIDSYGKLRGIELEVNVGSQQSKMSVFTLPSAPINYPVSEDIHATSFNTATRLFGTPSKVMASGVWFGYGDWSRGVYVPLNKSKVREDSVAPWVGIKSTKFDDGDRKKLKIILSLVQWAYVYMSSEQTEPKERVATFMSKHTFLGGEEDYRLEFIPRIPPTIRSTGAIMKYIEDMAPTLVSKRKFRLYSEKFSRGIAYALLLWTRETSVQQQRMGYNPRVAGILERSEELAKHIDTKLIIRADEMKKWVKMKEEESKITYLKRTLTHADSSIAGPFLYKDSKGLNYIIRNNQRTNKPMESFFVAAVWKERGIITQDKIILKGCDIVPENYIQVLYRLRSNNMLQVISVVKPDEPTTEFIEVLQYSSGRFAAMLPI